MGVSPSKKKYVDGIEDAGGIGVELPDEVWIQIFSYVKATTLICSVPLVCSHWQRLTDDLQLWLLRIKHCRLKISPNRMKKIRKEWSKASMRNAVKAACTYAQLGQFNQNILLNPYAEEGFSHWKVNHQGDGMIIEDIPAGAPQIPTSVGSPTAKCFVTSYRTCSRSQEVDLEKTLKIFPFMLYELQPTIRASEWAAARWDCNSWCQIKIYFKRKNFSRMSSTDLKETLNLSEWIQMTLSITADYVPPDLASISYKVMSGDSAFWAGHYGAKTTGSSVIIDISSD